MTYFHALYLKRSRFSHFLHPNRMSIQCILYALSADSSLGRVDKSSLSQQTLMELFIEKFTQNKAKICGSTENPKDISEWTCTYFNASDAVVKIVWIYLNIEGSLGFKWLPLSMQEVLLTGNKLSGTVNLTCLPDSLINLSLSSNAFEGTVDLTQLPSGLLYLFLDNNAFYGETDFSQLPESLRKLDVSKTKLRGEIWGFCGTLNVFDSKVRVGGVDYSSDENE